MILLKLSQDEQTLTFLVQNNRTGLDNFTRDFSAWEQLVSRAGPEPHSFRHSSAFPCVLPKCAL